MQACAGQNTVQVMWRLLADTGISFSPGWYPKLNGMLMNAVMAIANRIGIATRNMEKIKVLRYEFMVSFQTLMIRFKIKPTTHHASLPMNTT